MENQERDKQVKPADRTAGLVHIYCGDGKGKTTASVGAAVRAAGSGKKVVIKRFLKRSVRRSGSFKKDSGDNASSLHQTIWIFLENESARERRSQNILQ